ncbi:hypothetical protein CesoFtcFv8_014097 [Champsocephalus esox]|uniref:Uncharacterized protein n=1 Tax=Champsocephalus esox TaxID=159716 RepID=A0AAN8GWI6_9TELE|nr:hypothetical protein CesoFtcFv8_014097 [Champsocephalus esox]
MEAQLVTDFDSSSDEASNEDRMADHHSGGTSDDRGEDPHHEMSDDEVEMAADDEGTDQQHEMVQHKHAGLFY